MPRAQAAEVDRLADIGARVGNANRDARRDEARPVGKVPYYTASHANLHTDLYKTRGDPVVRQ
jgi:hypothetical protein